MSGAGESSTESASVAGFGSQAAYDATLNDSAIRTAVASTVSQLISELAKTPWNTAILKVDQNQVFISGGKSQGLRPGMQLAVETRGEKIKSPQTGFDVTLPGRRIATIQLQASFGDSETNEGSVATVTNGSLQGFPPEQLTVIYRE
jgi:hypothetical protein